MCKQWDVVDIKIVRTSIFFVPKVMKEVFPTASEFVSYYSSRYPLLFGNGILRITQETYDKLKRCYEGSMILPLIISPKEFTRRRNNMITIVRNSDSKQVKIGVGN